MHATLPTILKESLEIKQMRLGLDRIKAYDAILGHPSQAFEVVHIAGTNGKGSVATKIAVALQREKKKVGLLTSPHLMTYCERIQINQQPISMQTGEYLLGQMMHQLKARPTYFELLTLLAFTYFAQQRVDLAVIEVGMGGRLDATNIVSPKLCVITSIDLDHTQYLGNTIEEIAREKGGIIKPGVPVVVGPRARYYPNCIEVTGSFAHYEEENCAIAHRALRILGLENPDVSVTPPCRFEKVGNVLFDVAHNPAAFVRLFERIAYEFPKKQVHVLLALSADKDIPACLEVIARYATTYQFVKIMHPRLYTFQEALSFQEAFQRVKDEECVLICGTFFMMADAKAIVMKELSCDSPTCGNTRAML